MTDKQDGIFTLIIRDHQPVKNCAAWWWIDRIDVEGNAVDLWLSEARSEQDLLSGHGKADYESSWRVPNDEGNLRSLERDGWLNPAQAAWLRSRRQVIGSGLKAA